MARLRDMRDLIKLVKKANDDEVKEFREDPDYADEEMSDYRLHSLCIDKESAIQAFAKTLAGDEQKARDTYGDATSKRYGYLRETMAQLQT